MKGLFKVFGKASKNMALGQFANELTKRQRKCVAEGKPITEEELVKDLTDDYKSTGKMYSMVGITLEELIETGKQALVDDTPLLPEPKGFGIVRKAVEKIGRNQPCPCGSGKKYKKCCGKGL